MTPGGAGRARDWAAVGAGFAVLSLVAAGWLAVDTRPPVWDYANHLERVVTCARDLAAGDVRAVLGRSSFYPPFVVCAAAAAYRLFPSDLAAAQAVVLGFLGAGMAAVYLLGRRLAGGAAGVAAALLYGSAPFMVYSSLRFQLDVPLASMVAVALVVLLETEGFRRPGWSAAAGLVLGLGMLTKPPFAAYVLAPLAVIAAGSRGRRALANLGLAGLIGVALCLPWYGLRLFGMAGQISNRSFKQAAQSGYPEALSWASLSYYPRHFATLFGALAVLLFLAGLVVAARRRQWFAVAAVIPAFLLFELLRNKNFRYALPLLPGAAVIAALAFDAVRGRLRTALAVALGLLACLQLSVTVAGVPRGLAVPLLGEPIAPASPPVRADWRQREILSLIARDSGGARRTVSIVPNAELFSVSNFRYYAVRDGRPLALGRAWSDYPLNVDYVVLKTGDQGPDFASAKARRVTESFAADPLLAAAFPVIGEFPLPDGSVATVRVRRPAPVTDPAPAELARRIEAGAGVLLREFVADATGLRVGLEYDDAALRRGTIRRVTIGAASALVGELKRPGAATLRLRDLRVVLDGLSVNPARVAADGRLEPLALERFRIERLTLAEADLAQFLAGLWRMRRSRVSFLPGEAQVHVAVPGPDVDLRLSILPGLDRRPVVLAARGVRVGGIPVPDALAGWVLRNFDPTLRWAVLPVPVEVAPVRIERGALEVGGP